MLSFKGTGTSTSPYAIDSDDSDASEVEVHLTQQASRSTSVAGSPKMNFVVLEQPAQPGHEAGPSVMQVDDNPPYFRQDQRSPIASDDAQARGTKRQRSASVDNTDHDIRPSANNSASTPVAGTRKARKRKRDAEKRKESCLDRLSRLTHNPELVPQYTEDFNPILFPDASPFAFLPQLNFHLTNTGFGFQSSFNQQHPPPFSAMSSHTLPHHEGSAYAAVPPANGFHFITPPQTVIGTPITSKPTGLRATSLKSAQTIGVEPDSDSNSDRGLFRIPENILGRDGKPYVPSSDCTLVLEQLPKQHRNLEYINAWARGASGALPVRVLIDSGSGSKALVELHSPEAARKAWASPKLGASIIGLKSHQLKGRPREDLIKAYWYRVPSASANVGEIEEGEIEETSRGKDTKKRARPTKKQRPANDYASGLIPRLPSNNGLPLRPPSFVPRDTSLHALPARVPAHNSQSTVKESDDMDLGSPVSSVVLDLPSNDPPFGFPDANSNRAWAHTPPPFPLKTPLEPRAMKHPPTEPNHFRRLEQQRIRDGLAAHHNPNGGPRAIPMTANQPKEVSLLSSTTTVSNETEAMEAALREQVLKSKRQNARTPSRDEPASTANTQKPTNAGPGNTTSPIFVMDDIDSFITNAVAGLPPKPPMVPRVNPSHFRQMKADLAARQRRAEMDIADSKRALLEKDRLRKDESCALAVMKPSAKLNLDYVPPKDSMILTVSDDENSDDDEE